jgi:hypothetical protein
MTSTPIRVSSAVEWFFGSSPHFSHRVVAKRRKGRPDKARDRDPRKRTVGYVEEADRVERRVQTGYMGNRIDREHG